MLHRVTSEEQVLDPSPSLSLSLSLSLSCSLSLSRSCARSGACMGASWSSWSLLSLANLSRSNSANPPHPLPFSALFCILRGLSVYRTCAEHSAEESVDEGVSTICWGAEGIWGLRVSTLHSDDNTTRSHLGRGWVTKHTRTCNQRARYPGVRTLNCTSVKRSLR